MPILAPPRAGLEARFEFDAVSLAPPPESDAVPISMTFGGTPLAGDVRAGGGALILPGREASASVSAGFARVRREATTDSDSRPEPEVANRDGRDRAAAGRCRA